MMKKLIKTMALASAIILMATNMSFFSFAQIDPNNVIDSLYVGHNDDMSTSYFSISKNADDTYHIFVYATAIRSPYLNTFSGDGNIVNDIPDGMDLAFIFVEDGSNGESPSDHVAVAFESLESIDFPVLINGDSYVDYLYNAQYSYEGPTAKNNLIVSNCEQSITLRTSASTGASEICQIPLNATVKFEQYAGNGFYKITYNGMTGYSLADYLELNTNVDYNSTM